MLTASLILATAVRVILDLEYPRVGVIRMDAADHVPSDLKAGMK